MSWSWMLFGWGAVIGVAGVVGSYAVGKRAHLEHTWRAYPAFIVMSLAIAVLAAAAENAWPLVAFAAYVAIANFVVPLLLIPRMRRPRPHACASATESCTAAACARCPLAG
jgi:predicted MFS family arabinose efflux permease